MILNIEGGVMNIDDPQIRNKNKDASQLDYFDMIVSENQFNLALIEEIYELKETKKAEGEKLFGTHITEAKNTLKKMLKK